MLNILTCSLRGRESGLALPGATNSTHHRSTETMYSVSTERRLLARFAGSKSSRTVVMISSTVSGVNDAWPSSGQTHA